MKRLFLSLCILGFGIASMAQPNVMPIKKDVSLIVLGTAQDAGFPQIGCNKKCCEKRFEQHNFSEKIIALGVVDPVAQKKFLFEATPDMTVQAYMLNRYAGVGNKEMPDGIFLTHAHIGHYTGLMFLGREGAGANKVPVYAMPRLKKFLETNGPWDQLVKLQNIDIRELANEVPQKVTENLTITPILVPHRDEYSETVGFVIAGPNKKALFIPDIDKWEKWDKKLPEELSKVDYAFIDATFFDTKEVNPKYISQIPHSYVVESMDILKNVPASEKGKVYFIHINHSNPLFDPKSPQTKEVLKNGFHIARIYDVFKL